MTTSPALEARRALVKLLLTLAAVYHAVLDLRRDSCDNDVNKAFKKLIVKVHPDKGGSAEDTKRLNAAKVKLWGVPSRSPDCSPVGRFWSWLRRQLRAMDLKDAVAKRPVLGKTAYKARVRRVCQTKAAQVVAANCARSLKKVCKIILKNEGAASGC